MIAIYDDKKLALIKDLNSLNNFIPSDTVFHKFDSAAEARMVIWKHYPAGFLFLLGLESTKDIPIDKVLLFSEEQKQYLNSVKAK